MKPIFFNPPFNEYNHQKKTLLQSIQRVLDSGWYVLGKQVEAFEAALAKILNINYCVGVANGVDALTLGLMALNIGPNDEVIVPHFTAFPTITGIQRAGAIPVSVDICGKTGLINTRLIEAAITAKTKAILPVHMYGQCCDMDAIISLAKKYNLRVLEDCAQSLGAYYNQTSCGAFDAGGAMSFYPTKNLGAIGDGGAFITNDQQLYERVKCLRNYGQTQKYKFDYKGLNSRLDEIQAAILLTKLEELPILNQKRNAIASFFYDHLPASICLHKQPKSTHVYHLFPLLINDREQFQNFMLDHGIHTISHYPFTISDQKAFNGYLVGSSTHANYFAKHIVSIPNNAFLTTKETKFIVETIQAYLNQ
tara:strand:- start:9539 stop:10633 length:1095 start_codon:yes stop_codon:yes gene_type:complete